MVACKYGFKPLREGRTRRDIIFSYLGESAGLMFMGSPDCWGRIAKVDLHERHTKLCELLKKQRKAARLTQTVVAERLGKPPSYVAKYEGGGPAA